MESQAFVDVDVPQNTSPPAGNSPVELARNLKKSKCITKLLLATHEVSFLDRDPKALMHPRLAQDLMRLVHVTEHIQAPRVAQGISWWGSRYQSTAC